MANEAVELHNWDWDTFKALLQETTSCTPGTPLTCECVSEACDMLRSEYAVKSDEMVRRYDGNPEFHLVFPKDNELQLDIDDDAAYAAFERVYELLNDMSRGLCSYTSTPSKSGLPKRHVTVTLPFEVDAAARITLQACLGSDGKRELLGWRRLLAGDLTPTLFIEKTEV